MAETIFIHIPKTGGTTINTSMQGKYWQTEPDFNYRHILPDKSSNSGDIFEEKNWPTYQEHTLFMMLRHPVDRLVSEYFFIRERQEFIRLLRNKPKDLSDYAQNRQTQNYMTGFLKGKKMYDRRPVTEKDLEDVITTIDKLPIYTGIFEHFGDSLAYFSSVTGIKWDKKIEKKRVTLRRPNIVDLPGEVTAAIAEANTFDMHLYNHCLEKFLLLQRKHRGNYSFHGDKFDHIIAYSARACFYEFCLDNKSFIKQNFSFFKDITFYLLNEKQLRDGRQFALIWNTTFLNTFNKFFPLSDLTNQLQEIKEQEDEIEMAYQIGQTIDAFAKKNPGKLSQYKEMTLDKSLVPSLDTPKSTFIKRLFRK
ncbi:MAG: sulfotransferase family 2 domain-containing protein [Crocinitomicaceae bacterium]|nr:sulfotransferase family 2 domain-containing protein [Crocinitomicaceae bacterium]